MRTAPVVLLSLLAVMGSVPGQSSQAPFPEAKIRELLAQPRWTANSPIPEPFDPPSRSDDPLPEPSIQEPFAIGEALYVEDRVPDAVVSLLARLRIPIVAPGTATAPGKTIALDRDEVRALIDLDLHDLQGADGLENLPYSFADLHAAVEPLLSAMSVEALAAAYQRAYESRPDDLVPKVMLGQPVEPEMRLTRAQIWLLLLDGFAAPDGETAWGTADRALPDLPSPVAGWSRAEWREVMARLPLVPTRRLFVEDSAAGRLSLRLAAQPPALVSRLSGQTLIAAKPGSLAGQQVTWSVPDDSTLANRATLTTTLGQPVAVGANGVAQLTYQPGADPTGGRGTVVREWSAVSASLPACPLVSGALAVPAPLCAQLIGDRRAEFDAQLSWRTTDRLHLVLQNNYTLKLGLPGIGTVKRWGEDVAEGTLVRNADGDYTGTLRVTAESTQTVVGSPTGECKDGHQVSTQRLLVESFVVQSNAEPKIGTYSSHTKSREYYNWMTRPPRSGRGPTWATLPPDEGYIGLEFFPDGRITYTTGVRDPCRPELSSDSHRKRKRRFFLPLNDAQWTTAGGGYLLGLQRASEYYFVDLNYPGDFSDPDGRGDSYQPFWTVKVRRSSLSPP